MASLWYIILAHFHFPGCDILDRQVDQTEDVKCRLQDVGAGCGLQVIVKSRPYFLINFPVDIAHGEFLLVKFDIFIVIFRRLDFGSVNFYISQNSLQSPDI